MSSPEIRFPSSPYAIVSGWYGHNNSGDEAILLVILSELQKLEISHSFVLTTADELISSPHAEYRAVRLRDMDMVGWRGALNALKPALWEKMKIQKGAALFIFGGGGLLRDNTTLRNLVGLLDDIIFARLMSVPIFFCAVGVGPIRTILGRALISIAARSASFITVRDEQSCAELQQLGVPGDRIEIVSDPALLLPPATRSEAIGAAGLEQFLAAHPRCIFVYPAPAIDHPPLAPRDGRHVSALANALSRLSKSTGWAVVLVPMQRAWPNLDDVEVCQDIARRMDPAVDLFVIESIMSPGQVMALTEIAGMNVTIRLHAMIYAVALGKPCVALNYEPKVAANARKFGLQDYLVDFDDRLEENIVDAASRLKTAFSQEQERLSQRLPGLRNSARATFVALEKMYRATRPMPPAEPQA